MQPSPNEIAEVRAYIGSSRELLEWITGARVLALLTGAWEAGILQLLRGGETPQGIVAATGLKPALAVDLCLALEAHGIVREDEGRYRLTPDYVRLTAPDAVIPLESVLRQADVMVRTLRAEAAGPNYTDLPPRDILAMAEGAGISALSVAPHVAARSIGRALPGVEARWLAGGRHLEVGCGVGNALFGILLTYPLVAAVGIEIDPETGAEARRRAGLLGVEDRVELRVMDACALEDSDAFDTIQWSQFFFPAPSRPVVLRAMRRALRPGGYLFMPWLGAVSEDTLPHRGEMLRTALRALATGRDAAMPFLNDLVGDTPGRRRRERRFASLQRLVFGRWGVQVQTVAELREEVEEAGFSVVAVRRSPANQFALTRGFLLARSGAPDRGQDAREDPGT